MKQWLLLPLLIITITAVQAAPDIALGKKLAETHCQACHGKNGHSPNPLWPSLAGQHATYLVQEMLAFKEGKKRKHQLMTPIMAPLNLDDIKHLAAFYANQKPKIGFAKQKTLKRGEQLYRGGDIKKGIPACLACHGPTGRGNGQTGFPSLQGQHAAYIIDELEDFEEGERNGSLSYIMQAIAKRMSKKDRAAVANYIEGLH